MTTFRTPQVGVDALFWEPWTPTREQRVRVRLSGECQPCETDRGFGRDVDGATGIVCMEPGRCILWESESQRSRHGPKFFAHAHSGPHKSKLGHWVAVHFEKPLPKVGVSLYGNCWWTGTFAVIELEPLEDPR